MRLERVGLGAAGGELERRGLYLEKAMLDHEVAGSLPECALLREHIAKLGIHDNVEIALAEALVGVSDAVPFLRQRQKRFRCHLPTGREHRWLAALRREKSAGRGNEVADIRRVLKEIKTRGVERIRFEDDLETRRAVVEHDEKDRALPADGHDAASDGVFLAFCLKRRELVAYDVERIVARRAGRIRIHAGGAEPFELFDARGAEFFK